MKSSGLLLALVMIAAVPLYGQEYAFDSYQVMSQNRYQEGAVGGFWGHHLGHLVRTRTQGLWHVGDTGNDVNINPALLYSRLEGNRWVQKLSLPNPATIQQNTATLALGDTLYTYGLNIIGGYIEEAVFDTRTNIGSYNRRIRTTGASTNYIGAALSPGGRLRCDL